MNTELISRVPVDGNTAALERLRSRRGEPLFVADWDRAVFIHYAFDPATPQPHVPFELDVRDGKAYVSLVAFTMRGMRLRFGGRLGAWVCRPIGTHDFLNVRTYIRHGEELGIYFIREWLSNVLSVRLGPLAYGLPYRLASIGYQHRHESGVLRGEVNSRDGRRFRYRAGVPSAEFCKCAEGSLDEFLLERYTAFTCHKSKRRFFRVWHEPWPQTEIEVSVSDCDLLRKTFPWFSRAEFVGANYSPGAKNVGMGWPHAVRA